jgi:excisionase family DNA binding protein
VSALSEDVRKPVLLTTREAAARLGYSERHVRRRIADLTLPAVRLGPGRAQLRIDADELEDFIYRRSEENQ